MVLAAFDFMCGRPMNLGLSPSSVTDLNESFHRHACYLKRFLSFLESLRFKVRRTRKDDSKEMCSSSLLRDFSYRKAFPQGRRAVAALRGTLPRAADHSEGHQSKERTQLGPCCPCEASPSGGLDCGSLKGFL